MSDDKEPLSLPPLLRGVLGLLGVSAVALASWPAAPSGDWTLPAKVLIPIGTAGGSLFLVWAAWTYQLWKRDSQREKVRDAEARGLPVCPCRYPGEIMTYHHSNTHGSTIAYWACPHCENCHLSEPAGTVPISHETAFRPPLPRRVHQFIVPSSPSPDPGRYPFARSRRLAPP